MEKKVAIVGHVRPCNNEEIEGEVLEALHRRRMFGFFCFVVLKLGNSLLLVAELLCHTERRNWW